MSLSDDDIFCILINVARLSQNFLDPKRMLRILCFVLVMRLRTKKYIYIVLDQGRTLSATRLPIISLIVNASERTSRKPKCHRMAS